MNSSIYIFGELTAGYTQYPTDGAQEIFKRFGQLAKSPTQLCIHRAGGLIYYGYIRKLTDGKYIGICVLLNDMYHTRPKKLIELFENVVTNMINQGWVIQYGETGEIITTTSQLHQHIEEVNLLRSNLTGSVNQHEPYCRKLPPVNFAVSKDSVKEFSIQDDSENVIIASSYTSGYTIVYKTKDYENAQVGSYKSVLAANYAEKQQLKKEVNELKTQVGKLKREKRNTTWVGVLGVVAAMMFVVLWFKVFFPTEVTNKHFPEFNYYGPMKDGKPNGVGVAVYHKNNSDDLRFYVGNFVDGERQDKTAMLLYNDGDYFYGEMKGNHFEAGTFYNYSDNSHFTGTFDTDNNPHEGDWYKHEFSYSIP